MKSLTKNLIPEVINQAISNKIVRKLAVRQLDKKIHDSIMEDQSLLFEEEKRQSSMGVGMTINS